MSVNRKGRRHTIALRLHMSNVMRGRQFSPEHLHNLRRGVQKLTDDQVREIRRRLNAGESQYVIASAFGIHQGSVSNIFRGKTYGDVSPTKWRQKVRAGAHKLTDAQVREIRQRLSAGESQYAIADLFGVHQGSVSGIFRRKTYRDVS
jgi:predicted XRE-type DNA-binding protein